MWIYILIFSIGLIVGVLLRSWIPIKKIDYNGQLVRSEEDGRILYSLELDDDIEQLQPQDHFTLKVVSRD